MTELELGKAKVVSESQNKKVAIMNFGIFLSEAEKAAEQLDATVIDMRFVKPMDTSLIEKLAVDYDLLVTVEDNAIAGGAGSGVNEYLNQQGYAKSVLNIGLPDQFIKHGTQKEIYQELGLTAEAITAKVQSRL